MTPRSHLRTVTRLSLPNVLFLFVESVVPFLLSLMLCFLTFHKMFPFLLRRVVDIVATVDAAVICYLYQWLFLYAYLVL